jgi:DNA-3-methyladenine glycosylase
VCHAGSPLRIGPPLAEPPEADISVGPRIGISRAADWPLRFWLTGDRNVSAYRAAARLAGPAGPGVAAFPV